MDAPGGKPLDRQALAEACARAMWAEDQASQGLGMKIERVRPGEAALTMPVAERMVNGHKICHGGFIFTLADSAFAFACNSYDERTVAQHCAVTFLAPARLGDLLTAHAVEVARSGRSGVYDITVTSQSGVVVAVFRGHSRTIKGSILEGT
ncbi:MAG TPA: hydroxyphenylacetyl-CoA thioesterase PaaI [Beijerinckiaceae bacterium]|nr:hydroxyphenylacetyl-CoA thioesterase PaaI [Beijerinckiaceae bacterium]